MSKRLTTEIFIDRSNIIHDNFYSYPNTNYINNKIEVEILCHIHGIFYQRPDSHLRGIGCNKCGIERSKKIQSKDIDLVIEDFNKFHNFKYDYSLIKNDYKNSHTKVSIICKKCGNIFSQPPDTHLRCGCPRCKESKGENIINDFLVNNNINFERQKKFDDCIYKSFLLFDFYLIDYNICIEYDGLQHYKEIKSWGGNSQFIISKKRDNIKNEFCLNNNIRLIRIKYDENIIEKLEFLK
jgi:very-short-patch-repair endonuclease